MIYGKVYKKTKFSILNVTSILLFYYFIILLLREYLYIDILFFEYSKRKG